MHRNVFLAKFQFEYYVDYSHSAFFSVDFVCLFFFPFFFCSIHFDYTCSRLGKVISLMLPLLSNAKKNKNKENILQNTFHMRSS